MRDDCDRERAHNDVYFSNSACDDCDRERAHNDVYFSNSACRFLRFQQSLVQVLS